MFEFSVVSAALVIFMLGSNLSRHGYAVILNPFFWVTILFLFYFLVPSLVVEEINYYFDWNLRSDSIFFSRLIAILATIFFALMLYFFKSSLLLGAQAEIKERCSWLVKILWVIVSFYLVGVLAYKWGLGGLYMTDSYTGEGGDPFKIKSVAYLLVTVSGLCFFERGRIYFFTPNFIVIVLDLLSGGRTAAFVALMPIVLGCCVYYKRLFIVPGIILCSLFILVGVVRSDNVVKNVPVYLDAIGEFRETFITLPIVIEDSDYVGRGDLYTLLAMSTVAMAQPFRGEIMATITPPGEYIYEMVNRGYGLGCNIFTEALYYGYPVIFLSFFGIFFVCLFIFVLAPKLRPAELVVIVSLLVVFLRLIVREGFFLNLGLFFFVFSFYCAPILILNRFRFCLLGRSWGYGGDK
tara:strand:- start:5475 stop:6698 length:1224 start_codon:yes stop_codon:yes gene_type:complete